MLTVKDALLEIVWKIELSEKSDRLSADIDVRPPLTLGQALHLVRLWSQAVEALRRVKEEVRLQNFMRKIEERFYFRDLSPRSLYQSVPVDNMNLINERF